MGKFVLHKCESGFTFIFKKEGTVLFEGCSVYSSKDDCQRDLCSLFQSITPSSIEDCTGDCIGSVNHPKFEIALDGSNQYFFNITGHDGAPVAKSGSYQNKLDCINAIDDVIKSLIKVI